MVFLIVNGKLDTKLVSIEGVLQSPTSSVTIAAGRVQEFTILFNTPKNARTQPFDAYIQSTGWEGVICQGVAIVGNNVTFTLYNATPNVKEVIPKCVALYFVY